MPTTRDRRSSADANDAGSSSSGRFDGQPGREAPKLGGGAKASPVVVDGGGAWFGPGSSSTMSGGKLSAVLVDDDDEHPTSATAKTTACASVFIGRSSVRHAHPFTRRY